MNKEQEKGQAETSPPLVETPIAQNLTPEALEAAVEVSRLQEHVKKQAEVIEQLREEIANLRNQISIATQGAGVPGHLAQMVAEKMKVGLSREDAIEVATRQLAHDGELLKKEKLAEEAKKKAEAEAKKKAEAEAKAKSTPNR